MTHLKEKIFFQLISVNLMDLTQLKIKIAIVLIIIHEMHLLIKKIISQKIYHIPT